MKTENTKFDHRKHIIWGDTYTVGGTYFERDIRRHWTTRVRKTIPARYMPQVKIETSGYCPFGDYRFHCAVKAFFLPALEHRMAEVRI